MSIIKFWVTFVMTSHTLRIVASGRLVVVILPISRFEAAYHL